MNQLTSPPTAASVRKTWNHWAGFAAIVAVLALVMMRAPVPLDVEPHLAYQSLLYETLRLGHTWGEALVTTDGPLAAVQAPAYASGSIWIAMIWQIGGNLLLALVLVGAAYQLPWTRRGWALGLFAATFARVPAIAPWIAMVLLGWSLIRPRGSPPLFAIGAAGLLGFLGLSSIGHLLLGGCALGLALIAPQAPRIKPAAALGFFAGILFGWLALGQPIHGLSLWLSRGFPALWQTSTLMRSTEIAASVGRWAATSGVALAVTLAFFYRGSGRLVLWTTGIFLAAASVLAWKAAALQPFGVPGIFFGTVIVSAFLLLHAGGKPAASVMLAAVAFGGLVRWQPLIFVDGIGHFNRQLILNLEMIAGLPTLRSTLHEQVEQLSAVQKLPRVHAAVGEATVDLIGGLPSQVILSKLNLRSRPAPIDILVRTPAIAGLNQRAMSGSNAPEFILQRLQPPHDRVPALDDATTQLELYRRYEFVLEEEGLMLWKRKRSSAEIAPLALIGDGAVSFGETVSLPQSADSTGYWLELDVHSNVIGSLRKLIDEVPPPGLLLRDEAGNELHYALPSALAARGFVIAPFIRGQPDLLRLQTGTNLPKILSFTVLPPATGGGLWNKQVTYRLYAVPNLNLTSHKLSSDAFEDFRLFNRVPIAVSYVYPIKVLPYEAGTSIAFAHPDSSVEFAATGHDRRVRASFGILHGAYEGKNASDGVDFSVEFIPADGIKQTLYHRLLNPVSFPEDRGLQQLNVTLPPGRPGRLILRTYNPPERNRSYDWSYWGDITIE